MGFFRDRSEEQNSYYNRTFSNSKVYNEDKADTYGTDRESVDYSSSDEKRSTEMNNDAETLRDTQDEVAVITTGLTVNGNLDSTGSIDVFGTVNGDVSCLGKLTVSGSITGVIGASEVYANDAHIQGNISSTGTVKIGKGTVILGNIKGSSAVIAGAVKGDIDIEGPIIIDSDAIIVGDISFKSIQINNGASIDGRCSQKYSGIDTASIFDFGNKEEIMEELDSDLDEPLPEAGEDNMSEQA